MAILPIIKLFEHYQVNPYKVLRISKNASSYQIKNSFKERMKVVRDDSYLRAEVCLAYDIMLNRNFYKECEKDTFEFIPDLHEGNVLCYYYTVIGDTLKLMTLILNEKKNKKLIYFKDPQQRNLS